MMMGIHHSHDPVEGGDFSCSLTLARLLSEVPKNPRIVIFAL